MSKNGLILLKPTTVDKTGGSSTATISANGSVEFSACATLSLNGVFSADYDNYMVVMRQTASSGQRMEIRFRDSGTDNTTASSYTTQYLYADGSSVTGARTSQNYGYFVVRADTLPAGVTAQIYGPYLAQPTAYRTVNIDCLSSAEMFNFAGTHNQSTSYDGFTLVSADAAHTYSGRIAVYGMRK